MVQCVSYLICHNCRKYLTTPTQPSNNPLFLPPLKGDNKTWGGGCTPYNGLYGDALLERGTFFRLQVYERVQKSVISVCKKKKAKKGYQMYFLGCKKVNKTFCICDLFVFQRQ